MLTSLYGAPALILGLPAACTRGLGLGFQAGIQTNAELTSHSDHTLGAGHFFRIAFRELHAHEDLSGTGIEVAIVELGDGAVTQQLDKPPVAAELRRDGDCQQSLPVLADLGEIQFYLVT
ncbi:hypothetical protein [Microvirga sp. P5_D2]